MQVYFDNIQSVIFDSIRLTEKSINIAVAWFTDRKLFDLICDLSEKGVSVELIVVDDEINRNANLDYQRLLDNGGSLTLIKNSFAKSLMHNKFCIIDKHTVITGSYNWTYKAQQNHENIVINKNTTEFAEKFFDEFKRIKHKYSTEIEDGTVERFISKSSFFRLDVQNENEDSEIFDEYEEEHVIYDYESIPRRELIQSVNFTISNINGKLKEIYNSLGRDTFKEDWSWALSLFENVMTRCPSDSNLNEQLDYLLNNVEDSFFRLSDYLAHKPNENATTFINNQYTQLIPLYDNDAIVKNSDDKINAIKTSVLFITTKDEKRRQVLHEHYNKLVNLYLLYLLTNKLPNNNLKSGCLVILMILPLILLIFYGLIN